MPSRRRFLAGLLVALVPVPAARAFAEARSATGPVIGHGFQIVNGWILTDRDVAEIARLDR